MRAFITALALASLVASPALAKTPAHHAQSQNVEGQNLYMYYNETPSTATQSNPPGVVRRGYLMTDPDPLIRDELNRGYMAGSTD
jgi:hypothetical protein